MAQEPEVIRQQMDETRTALTDKLETLEHRVVDTVQEATCAVSQSVDCVKEAVQDTVHTVQHSVHETVASVKEALDLRHQIAKRPWTMMAGAAALGYLGGYLVNGPAPARKSTGSAGFGPPGSADAASRDGQRFASELTAGVRDTARNASPAPAQPNWLSQVGKTFRGEINQLKGLAIGTMLGLARDMAVQAVAPPLAGQVKELIDDVTVKLGGQPIHGQLLPEAPAGTAETEAQQQVSNGRGLRGCAEGSFRATESV